MIMVTTSATVGTHLCATIDWACAMTGKEPTLSTCNPSHKKVVTKEDAPQPVEEGQEVFYTYDVLFRVRCSETNVNGVCPADVETCMWPDTELTSP